jgi:hypothetical protein
VLALKKGIFMRHWMTQSTIPTACKLHWDNLALCPISTDPPTAVTTIEHTGGVNNNLQLAGAGVEEGNFHETLDDAVSKTAAQEESDNPPAIVDANNADDEEPPDLVEQDNDDNVSEADYNSDREHDQPKASNGNPMS